MSTRGCTRPAFTPSRMFDDGLLEDHRRARRARQPVVVVLHRDERLRAGAGAELRERIGDVAELVDGQQPVGKLELLERRLAVEREDLVRQPVLPGEAVGADGARAVEVLLVERAVLLLELLGQEIRQLVVVTRITREGRDDRVQLEVFFPELGVQLAELGGLVGGARDRSEKQE